MTYPFPLRSTQVPTQPRFRVGVREFREQIARFLESDAPVAVTRRDAWRLRSDPEQIGQICRHDRTTCSG